MALSNASNTQLAPVAIAESAWSRLCDAFPLNLVSHATGPKGFKYARPTTASTGTIATVNEAAVQASETTFQPTIGEVEQSLATYRAAVTISNELLGDSMVYEFIADRLSCQIIEAVGKVIIGQVSAALSAASRVTATDHWDIGAIGTGGTAKIHDHSGHYCLSNVSNAYRERGCWVFSPDAWRNWGTQERNGLVTLGVRREPRKRGRLIGEVRPLTGATSQQQFNPLQGDGGSEGESLPGETLPPGGGGPRQGGGNSQHKVLATRSIRLEGSTVEHPQWQTAYLGAPVYTSDGLDVTNNANTAIWGMFVDLTAYLLFDQPLTVALDTESKLSKNQTVVHAAYRAVGAFMEPTAGWGLASPA